MSIITRDSEGQSFDPDEGSRKAWAESEWLANLKAANGIQPPEEPPATLPGPWATDEDEDSSCEVCELIGIIKMLVERLPPAA